MAQTKSLTSSLDRMHARPDGLYGKLEQILSPAKPGIKRRIELLERNPGSDRNVLFRLQHGRLGLCEHVSEAAGLSEADWVDISCSALKVSVKLAKQIHATYADNFTIFQSDGMELSVPDESVDLIFAGKSIEHTTFSRRFLSECHHILRAHGQKVITTPNRDALIYTLMGEDYCTSPEHLWLFTYDEVVKAISEDLAIEEGYGYNGTIAPEMDTALNSVILAGRWSASFANEPQLASGLILRVRKREAVDVHYVIRDIRADDIAYLYYTQYLPLDFGLKSAFWATGECLTFTRPSRDGLVCRLWSHRWSAEIVAPRGLATVDLYSFVPGWQNRVCQRKNIVPEDIVVRCVGEKHICYDNSQVIFFETFRHGKLRDSRAADSLKHGAPIVCTRKAPLSTANSPLNLMRPGREFARHIPFVGTTFFNWFTATAGNLRGHWPPPGGRSLWSGDVGFWLGQLKQVMMSNIDAIYVHYVNEFHCERANFFLALKQLRGMGWDVPKIAPFLDTFAEYRDNPIDVATRAGKDAIAGQYIRFFEEYLSVCNDPHAASYLLHIDGKVVITSWWVANLLQNIDQLTRSDIEERLVAALGDRIPSLKNGVYMISTAFVDPDYLFSDERMVMFSGYCYGVHSVHDGVDVWHVQPGYWDQNVRVPGYFLPRAGGKHYRSAWEAVIAAMPHVHRVYVESWNEYEEGSGIYAATPGEPWCEPDMHVADTDFFSSDDDPFEYIKTTAFGASKINQRALNDSSFLAICGPAEAAAGSEILIVAVVRNEGNAGWSGAAGYALQVAESLYAIDDSENDVPLYGAVFRGRTVAFLPKLKVPSEVGRWKIPLTMVFKGAGFGEQTFLTTRIVENSVSSAVLDDQLLADVGKLNASFLDQAEAALFSAKCRIGDRQSNQLEESMIRTPAETKLLRSQCSRLTSQVSQQNIEINRMRKALAERDATDTLEITSLRQMLSECETTLVKAMRSKSWRLTAPLRRLASFLRKRGPQK